MYSRYTLNKRVEFKQIIPMLTLFTDLCLSDIRKEQPRVLRFIYRILDKSIDQSIKQKEMFPSQLKEAGFDPKLFK